jgi:predicted nucleic acid-binding protein
MTDEAKTPSVYVDANPFIYLVEGEDAVAMHLKTFFELLRQRPGTAMTSELTLAEVLPKARPDARRSYFNLIVWSGVFHLQPATRDILVDTADYRRVTAKRHPDGRSVMPKIPDAIHVVTATRSRCRMFLSADSGLKVPSGMTILEPNEAGLAALREELA